MRSLAAALVAALVCTTVHAQDRTDLWRSYAERLPTHSLVVVALKNGERIRGHLVAVTNGRVVVLRKTRVPVPPSTLALDQIESIEPQKEGWSPGAKVLMGIGAPVLLFTVLAALALRNS